MARGLGGVMVALAVRDGPALVRFQAKPLGELAQRESDRFASDRSWVRIPYSPLVVGPDIKMAPHSTVRSRSREKTWHCGRVVKAIAC